MINCKWTSQDLTDAAGRKAAADLLDVLLRAPETFRHGASDDRLIAALAELAKKVLSGPLSILSIAYAGLLLSTPSSRRL